MKEKHRFLEWDKEELSVTQSQKRRRDVLVFNEQDQLTIESRDDDYEHLYIVLTFTGTPMSHLIRKLTRQPFSHASIGLDRELKQVFAYNFKGFVREDFYSNWFKGVDFAQYALPVSPQIHDEARKALTEYLLASELEKAIFNFKGLLEALFKRNFFSNDDLYRAFCSEFVVRFLRQIGVEFHEGKQAKHLTPYELVHEQLLRHVRTGKLPPE